MAEYFRNRYHSHRPARFTPASVPSGHVGIELEVESRRNLDFRDLLQLLPDIQSPRRPIVEEDGSLSEWRGMEIVFPPFSPRQLTHKNGAVRRVMDALRNSVVEDENHIGMHYNYSTNGWSGAKKATFCAIIHNLPLRFLEQLAARDPEGYDERLPGHCQFAYFRNSRQFCGNRSNRIEVRFFGSTTDTQLLRLRLDFLAVVEAAAESAVWDDEMCRGIAAEYNVTYEEYHYVHSTTDASRAVASRVADTLFSDALASMKGKKWKALRQLWKEYK